MRVETHNRNLFPPGGELGEQMRQHLLQLWTAFKKHGLVSWNFVEQLCRVNRRRILPEILRNDLGNHLFSTV
jgi:hypothetical protein